MNFDNLYKSTRLLFSQERDWTWLIMYENFGVQFKFIKHINVYDLNIMWP